MTACANPSPAMVLVTFAGDDGRAELDTWVRDVATPRIVEALAPVACTSWRIERRVKGTVPFSHFLTAWVRDAPAVGAGELLRDAPAPAQALTAAAVALPDDGGRRTRACLIVTYTPREDAAERGYDDWLRAVDNPFFNHQPEVASYANWRIVPDGGADPGYTDLDLFHVDGADGYERLFGANDAARAFAREWRRKWGRNPDALDPGESSSLAVAVALVEHDAGAAA